jgi:hypothetical protein
MTDEDAFVLAINSANDAELLAELREAFLDRPFQWHTFDCTPEELPFVEPVGTRGSVVTFKSQFRGDCSRDLGLARDVRLASLLPQMGLNECHYGADGCPIHPFICELADEHSPLTGADIVAALQVRNFRSEHIRTLDAPSLSFPGYHPDTDNDEIHNDFAQQLIFGHERKEDELTGHHGVLKRYVSREQVWYVLLHTEGPNVILLGVGRSPHGKRLLGVITHQRCHNLCD